ncbi:MAG: LacI family DNA-binding transcriptional regulator, partial [Oscillospiraceae bacterium]|nr:LacI family DNA-binding transcriptional regulator [Oscillospiraceae bacterium]
MTIKDIARESGYAVSTVSRALNNHPDVSTQTKEKINAIV